RRMRGDRLRRLRQYIAPVGDFRRRGLVVQIFPEHLVRQWDADEHIHGVLVYRGRVAVPAPVQELLMGEILSAVPWVGDATIGTELAGQHRVNADRVDSDFVTHRAEVALPQSAPVMNIAERVPEPIADVRRVSVRRVEGTWRVADALGFE